MTGIFYLFMPLLRCGQGSELLWHRKKQAQGGASNNEISSVNQWRIL